VNNSADVFIKERLKKQIDEVDEEMGADLLDLIDAMNTQFEQILLSKYCWFTLDKFVGLIKKELIRRVRRNNLKVKLCGINKEKYIQQIMTGVKEQYKVLQLKAAAANCADRYTDFSQIEDAVREVIGTFFDETKRVVIGRIESKIRSYEAAREEFKTAELRKQACETPLSKNKDYIKHLQEAAG
jgi:hypothetical protein